MNVFSNLKHDSPPLCFTLASIPTIPAPLYRYPAHKSHTSVSLLRRIRDENTGTGGPMGRSLSYARYLKKSQK